jgi:enoyl-CoA hydratase
MSATDPAYVRLEVSDGIGTIRIDKPPMNALDRQIQEELRLAAAQAADRQDVCAVVVYGGPKIFAAGADVKEFQAMSYQDMVARVEGLQSALGAIATIAKPTVAAITGFALGGGLEVALGCDFRVCGDNARLGTPEITLGIIPGGGGTQRLARLVGSAKAKDIVFSGRQVRADEALAIGLVDEVVPPDDVYEAARARVARYVNGPALALRAAKLAIDDGLDGSLDVGLAIERQHFASLFATEDRTRGMTSFVEEGPGKAKFVGR